MVDMSDKVENSNPTMESSNAQPSAVSAKNEMEGGAGKENGGGAVKKEGGADQASASVKSENGGSAGMSTNGIGGGGSGEGGAVKAENGNNAPTPAAASSGDGSAPSASAPAAAAPPPPPLLKGTLSYNLEMRRHIIRGMWNYENSTAFPPQRFELLRNLAANEDPTVLPMDGEFHGSFSLAYYHTTSKGRRKERSKVIPESGVKITFKKKLEGGYDVSGQGTNQFGVFEIKGVATGSSHAGDPSYNVELRKKYIQSAPAYAGPVAGGGGGGGVVKKKDKKSKKRKHSLIGAAGGSGDGGAGAAMDVMDDSGPLPPPSQSYPSNVVCLRGNLVREQPNEAGLVSVPGDVVHRVSGMWSSGLDLIQADPQNIRGLCNRFEYEHRCTGPSDVFPLSGRYTGWFYLSNEDGSRTRVAERDVTFKFRKNNEGYYNVEGRGSNVFGKYSITGTLSKDNVLTIFRHFQPRKSKKSSSSSVHAAAQPSPVPVVGAPLPAAGAAAAAPPQPRKDVTPAPQPINGAPILPTAASRQPPSAQQQLPLADQCPARILTLDMVTIPGESHPDQPIMPLPPPPHGTYSAISRGVLRINDDGAHTCAGKWAMTREHFTNGQTSNFHFGLEAHHAQEGAIEAEKKKGGAEGGKEEGGEGGKGKEGDEKGKATDVELGGEGSSAGASTNPAILPGFTSKFPVDSDKYKGSFKMRRGGTKFQSIVDQQIVLKFRKNTAGSYNVHGKGINSIGTFDLVGTLIASGKGSGHVELYRVYPPPPAAVAPTVGGKQLQVPPGGKGLTTAAAKTGGVGAHRPGQVIPTTAKPKLAGGDAADIIKPPMDGTAPGAVGPAAMAIAAPLPAGIVPASLVRRESSRQTKLPSRLEDDDPKAQLQRIMDKCQTILKFLREKDMASGSFFSEPVDPVAHGIPTYHEVIKNPMDLGTVQTKMAAGEIETPEEFGRLVRLVFENAMTFNVDSTHVVHQAGRALLTLFNQKFRDVLHMTEVMRKARKPTKAELKDMKRREKEAAREAKRKAKEERKCKMKGGAEGQSKKQKIDEVKAMAEANSKALAAIISAAPPMEGAGAGVTRTEFNLVVQMMEQMQEQMKSMQALLVSVATPPTAAAAASAVGEGTGGMESLPVQAAVGTGGASSPKTGNKATSSSSKPSDHAAAESTAKKSKKKSEPEKAPAPAPAPAPPPAVEEEKALTLKEQENLTEAINNLPPEKLPGVIQIIRESATLNDDEEEIDLEIDQLDTATQRKLQRFVLKNTKQPRRSKGTKKSKAATAAPVPAPAPAPAPAAESPAVSPEKDKKKPSDDAVKDEEVSPAAAAKDSSKSKSSDSFFGFERKGDDSDSDSDSDDSNDGGGAPAASGKKLQQPQQQEEGEEKEEETFSKKDKDDDENAFKDDGFGIDAAHSDHDDDDDEGMATNWDMSAKPSGTSEAGNDNKDKHSDNDDDSDDSDDDGGKDLWGAARKKAAALKASEADRKARESKMKAEAEALKKQRLAEEKARGDEIRAQRLEEEEREARLKEEQERQAEEARQAARDAARAQVEGVVQTVDLDATRDIMKQYEQSFLDKEMGGGGASPSSDFGF